MADPSKAFRDNPQLPCKVELDYEGVSPMFGGETVKEDGSALEIDPEKSFAKAHYEQHMAAKGRFTVGEETLRDRRPRPARQELGSAPLAGDQLVPLVPDELRAELRDDDLAGRQR